ncbi:MAG: hypothetical protein KJ767_00735 [Nanoarchaeota archaeon]|nr:hypothetical protein [Nanoarchaeota archaeon]
MKIKATQAEQERRLSIQEKWRDISSSARRVNDYVTEGVLVSIKPAMYAGLIIGGLYAGCAGIRGCNATKDYVQDTFANRKNPLVLYTDYQEKFNYGNGQAIARKENGRVIVEWTGPNKGILHVEDKDGDRDVDISKYKVPGQKKWVTINQNRGADFKEKAKDSDKLLSEAYKRLEDNLVTDKIQDNTQAKANTK